MRLILVRHGQTPCNVDGIWHGWDDCPLNETGTEQARAAAQRLAHETIHAVYSSDLRRARLTALAIAEPHALDIQSDPDLRERHAGQFDGLRAPEVEALYPDWMADRTADLWGWTPPGGETFTQVLERTLRAVERLYHRHPNDTIVVVTHMGPVRVLTSHYGGLSMEETYAIEFASTGLTIFQVDENGVRAKLLNDATHVVT